MYSTATVTVDLAKITENTRQVISAVGDLQVVGVTKVVCGSPEVARAMLEGGAVAIGESRLANIERLRNAGITAPVWLLRAPEPELAPDVLKLADVSLASELASVEALDRASARLGRRHAIVAMVDVGDLREGMLPEEFEPFLRAASRLEHVEIAGIGTSLTCYGAIVPSEENLGELVRLGNIAERLLGRRILVSGGMSSSIELASAGRMPAGVTNLRVGESILLGVSTVTREPLPGLRTDAIVAAATVIECKLKPTVPVGEAAQDAFGGRPEFRDRGTRRRAICAIGRQDVVPEGLRPVDSRIHVLGASSDHLVLDVHDLPEPPAVGDRIAFVPNYAATLRLFTSPYVEKHMTGGC
jgi:predicted amino acid racemase